MFQSHRGGPEEEPDRARDDARVRARGGRGCRPRRPRRAPSGAPDVHLGRAPEGGGEGAHPVARRAPRLRRRAHERRPRRRRAGARAPRRNRHRPVERARRIDRRDVPDPARAEATRPARVRARRDLRLRRRPGRRGSRRASLPRGPRPALARAPRDARLRDGEAPAARLDPRGRGDGAERAAPPDGDRDIRQPRHARARVSLARRPGRHQGRAVRVRQRGSPPPRRRGRDLMDDNEPDESTRRVLSGASWSEFCDALKAAGAVVLDPKAPDSPLDRAEGYRYLTRLTRAALETFVEDADPLAPELLRTGHETIKMGADNPDNLYQNAPIHGKYDYRIRGQRGTVHYLGFGTQEGNYGSTGSLPTGGYLDDSRIRFEPDGTFEILVSATPKSGNWLPMTAKARTLVVRQTFLDRATEKRAELTIERIGGRHAPRALTAQAIDRGLAGSARFVAGCSRLFHQWAVGFMEHPNELPLFDPKTAEAAGGVPHIAYYHGYWALADDEALVIEVTPPECDYWNF